MKKKIKKFAEGGYQGREGQKALNVDELSSLNVNTGKQSSPTNVKNGPYTGSLNPLGKALNSYATNNPDNPFIKMIKNAEPVNDGLPHGTVRSGADARKANLYTMKMLLGPSLGMKKGGKVKARKPKDGRIKKAKCRDGIAQRGKTRGKMR